MKIFLTNLGKYNEGYLVGEWLELPATDEKIEESLKRIQVDGVMYEEYFITDYEDSPIELDEYENLNRLNEIAEKFEKLNETEETILKFLMSYHYYDFEKAVEKLEESNYLYYCNIDSDEDLGYAISENWEIPEFLKNYIDYEAIGRDYTYSGWVIYDHIAIYKD